MNAEGHLSDIDFLDLLIAYWRERFTGAVRAENDAIIKIIYFREGELLSASTNDRADSLGEILLRHSKISREHLKQGMAKRKEEESLGESLLALGFISRRELLWARRTQLVGAIRSILEWKSGEYSVISGYVPRREEGPPFPFPQVILEVILTRVDREPIDRELELGSLVLEKADGFEEFYADLNLNEEADGIVRLVDGRRSAVRVAVASDADRFNVFKLLVALKRLGLLKVPGEEPTAEGEAALESPEDGKAIAAPLIEAEGSLQEGTGEAGEAAAAPESEVLDSMLPPPEPKSERKGGLRTGLLLLVGLVILGGAAYLVAALLRDVPLKRATRPAQAAVPSASPSQAPMPIIVESAPLPTLEPQALEPSPAVSLPPLIEVAGDGGGAGLNVVPAEPTPEASPSPTPAPAPPAGEDPLRARYDAMAEEYARAVPAGFAVQFGIFCRTESITNALAADAENVWFVPAIFRGQPCYRAYWGRFQARAAADAALAQLPEPLREGTRPAVMQVGR